MKLYVVIFRNHIALVTRSERSASEYAKELAESLAYPVFNQRDNWFKVGDIGGTLATVMVQPRTLGEKMIKPEDID